MILSRYMLRKYVVSFLGILLVVGLIILLLDLVEQVRRFGGEGGGMGLALQLAALRMAGNLYGVLPLVALLATLAMFVALARSSELVVTRAVGRSALRVVATPALGALMLGAVAVAVLNPVVSAATRQYDQMTARLGETDASLLSVGRDGLWLREAAPEGQRVIRATAVAGDGVRLAGVTVLSFAPDGRPLTQVEAASATLTPGAWQLAGARVWDLAAENPEASARSAQALELPTDLTPSSLRDSFGPPDTISIWDLPEFIATLERAGFAALEHRVWLQRELAMPVMLAAMVLVGAAFTMGHIRAGRQGLMVLAALLAGFGAYFLRDFAQVLGENAQIPVALAAWSPPVVAAALALALLLQLEEG